MSRIPPRAHRCLSGLALALILLPGLEAQSIGADRSRGRYMLGVARDHITRRYYDSTFGGIDLNQAAARADSLIRVARSNTEIFIAIADFVQSLGDSHTRFYPPARAAEFEYGWSLQMVGDSCYVVKVDSGSHAEARGLMVGDRLLALDGHEPTRGRFPLLPYFLHFLSPRPSVRMEVERMDGSHHVLDVQARITSRPPITDLGAKIREFANLEREWINVVEAGPDVKILQLPGFGDRFEIDRAMGRVREAGTLILDLRGNPGGTVEGLVRLAGHIFDHPVVVDTVHERNRTRTDESQPVRTPFTGRLYLLIDSKSGSAAEIFARLVQLEGRGMVVGDRSSGQVMQSMVYSNSVGATTRTYYAMQVTVANVIMSDGGRLEGEGVLPDALVLPSAADIAAGRDPALATALTMAGVPTSPTRAGALLPEPGFRQ